jgi:hypothetical protein
VWDVACTDGSDDAMRSVFTFKIDIGNEGDWALKSGPIELEGFYGRIFFSIYCF